MKVIIQHLTTLVTFFILVSFYYAYSLQLQNSFLWIDTYLLLFLTLAFIIIFINSLKKMSFQKIKKTKLKFTFVFLNVIFIFFYNFSQINAESLSRDELTQIELSQLKNPFEACALQSQPPLSCALSKISWKFFGASETGSRLHVATASFFASMFILLISFYFIENYFLASLIAWGFLLHPIFVQYSYEIRPISLGVLWCAILFSNLVLCLESEIKFDLKKLMQISAIAFVFLNTVGLQPVLVVTGLILSFLSAFILSKNKVFLYFSLSLIAAVLLYLPIQFEILHSSEVAFGPVYFFTENLLKLTEIAHEDFFHLFLKLGGAIAIFSAAFILYEAYFKKNKSSDFKIFISLFLYCTATYFLMRIFFKLFIFFKLHDRYLFTLWVPLVFTLIHLIRQLNLKKNLKTVNYIFFVICLFLITASFYAVQKFNFIVNRFDQKSVFTWVNQNFKAGDRVIMKCLPNTEGFCFSLDENLKSAPFYFKPNEQAQLDFSKNSIESFLNLYKSNEKFSRLFVIIERSDGEKIQIPNENLFEVVHLKNEAIIILTGDRRSLFKKWTIFINSFETRNQEQNKILFQEKIQNALIARDFELYSELAYEFILNNTEYDDLAFIEKFKASELIFFGRTLF